MDKKISLCMIVKNEEKNIRRCIDSIRDIVDEIIIVDTGSTDKTIDIVNEYRAKSDKPTSLYNFEWTGDFSVARNESLKYATGDWILVLDGDEEFVGSRKDLQELTSAPVSRPIVYQIRIENILDEGHQVEHHMGRFFPNKKGVITYGAPIHEHLISTEGNLLQVTTDKVKIKHYGYGSQIQKDKNKALRNVEALEEEIRKNPRSAFYLYHLGITLRIQGKNEEAIEHFKTWDEIVSALTEPIDLSMGYAAYLGCFLTLNRFEEGKIIGDKVHRKCSHNPDFCLNYGIILEHCRLFDQAMEFLKRAVASKNNKFPAMSYDRDSMGWKSLAVMGNIHAQRSEYKKAVKCWEECLLEVPKNKDVLRALIGIYHHCGELRLAEDTLKKFIEYYPEEATDNLMVMLGNIYTGTGRLEEALEIFWKSPNRKMIFDQLLTGYISYQEYEKAQKVDDFLKQKEAKNEGVA